MSAEIIVEKKAVAVTSSALKEVIRGAGSTGLALGGLAALSFISLAGIYFMVSPLINKIKEATALKDAKRKK